MFQSAPIGCWRSGLLCKDIDQALNFVLVCGDFLHRHLVFKPTASRLPLTELSGLNQRFRVHFAAIADCGVAALSASLAIYH